MDHSRYEETFISWLRNISCEIDFDLVAHIEGVPEFSNFMHEIFVHNGTMSLEFLGPILHARRQTLVENSIDILMRTSLVDLGDGIGVPLRYESPYCAAPVGRVLVGDEEIKSFGEVGVLAEVAEAVQSYLAVAKWLVWPRCPQHGVGLHVISNKSAAFWHCTVGDHKFPILNCLQ